MPEISLKAEEIFHIGSFPVTNALLLSFVSLLILVILSFLIKNRLKMVPGKLQSVFELLLEQILKLMDSVLGDRKLSEKYLPIVATIFLFIMTSNWLGLLPLGSIGLNTTHQGLPSVIPLFRSPASDLNFTVALAVISLISINLLGILAIGFKKHFSKFFNFHKPFPVISFVGVLEFLSEFVKIVSFSFRLFGNVFAGEVLLVIVGFLVPYVVPLPFMFLEVFVGFIQAFIFSMLTLVFVAMATAKDGGH
ncbi:MAG: F0F1 ATP synthase subunit A [Candidatus Liptonbacteria bacterium]|nr:F0F1 ATP synthase subunit A [Candidatus Liptonbacteria bacterium]